VCTLYADIMDRPSLPPGRYFRLLILGNFKGLDSERRIAWRAADSMSVRQFQGLDVGEQPPDHSTISRTRMRMDLETHRAVFTWILSRLAEAGLVKGKAMGVDATTLDLKPACQRSSLCF
jgi:transposase